MAENPIPDVIYLCEENINAKQSRKVTSSDRFICNLHIFLGKNEKTTLREGRGETPSSCSRFRHQRLRNSRYRLQILDTRMGLLIIIVLPATCLVEKLSCTHMINRIYHHITQVTRESHLSGVTMICKPRRGFSSRGCCKPWEREWDSIVPSAMWWLVIFSHVFNFL